MRTLEQFSLKLDNSETDGSYYKIGEGFPIVLLHGFAETFEIWNTLILTLSKEYQLIIPHIPGCGTKDSFAEEFTMERIAQYVNAILEKEKIEKTILFGHSMGGYAAMAFAENYSDKLLGLSLVHSSAAADTEEKKEVRKKAIEHIQQNGKEGFFRTLIPKLYGSLSDFSEEKKEHLEMASKYSAEQIIACYTAMMNRPDRKYFLEKLNCPIQLIGGKEDQSVNYESLIEQAKLSKTPSLQLLEHIGHTSMNENPKLLLEAIIGFVDDILQTNQL